jgi:hypothetical protein
MAATSISFTFIKLIFIEFDRPEHAYFRLGSLIIALVASFFICLSRLYLGMHSVLDVLVGTFFAFFLSILFLQSSDVFLSLVRHSFATGLLIYMLIVLVAVAYPCNNRKAIKQSTARSDTFLILGNKNYLSSILLISFSNFFKILKGVAGGLVLGFSLKDALGVSEIGKLTNDNTVTMVLRFIVGGLNVQVARYVSRAFLCSLVEFLSVELKAKKIDVREHIKSNFYLDLFFYYLCYTCVSFSAVFTSFYLFHYLNLC